MNLFEKQHSTYRFVMYIVGLWPFYESAYRIVHRTIFPLLVFGLLVTQIISLVKSNVSMRRCIIMCSTICPVILCVARYVCYLMTLGSVRSLFELMRREEKMLQDPNELQILSRYYENSSHLIYIFLCVCFIGYLFFASLLLSPLMLDLIIPLNESRTRYVSYFTELFTEEILYIDMMCLQFLTLIGLGLLCLVCTESTIIVLAHYLCGLLKITSYRVRNAITNATKIKQTSTNYAEFHRIADIHNRAIQCLDSALADMTISYLIASGLVVVSFALSLHRLSQAITLMNDVKEIIFVMVYVVVHLLFMFLSNYCGQLLIDDGLDIFNEIYNSTWYEIPLAAQKLLLFIMLKSSGQCSFNLSGLFVPCYNGFSMMMSTSFSYFTVLYSSR